jgi:hypothetical protein
MRCTTAYELGLAMNDTMPTELSNKSRLEVDALKTENSMLRQRITQLEQEIAFLKTHPALLQGLKGETIVAKLTGGSLTKFAAQHDITVGSNITIEVKFSKLNTPSLGGSTRRWNWSKPLGWKDKGKAFDFLLLMGDKDARFPKQYLDECPYVYFLIPRARVVEVMTKGITIGSNVQITTNLSKARSPTSEILKKHMVAQDLVIAFFNNTVGVPES